MSKFPPAATLLISTLLSSSAFAATTVNYFEANSITGSSNEGTVTTANVATSGDLNRIITYTIVDIDFDGDGSADTLEVVIQASSTGVGTVSPTSKGALGIDSTNSNRNTIDASGESIEYSFTSASVELASGIPAPDVTFGGFNQLSFEGYGRKALHLLDGVEGNANDTNDSISLGLVDSFEIGYSANSGSGFYLDELSFSVIVPTIAVPEPS